MIDAGAANDCFSHGNLLEIARVRAFVGRPTVIGGAVLTNIGSDSIFVASR
jgi:hypothetical protein